MSKSYDSKSAQAPTPQQISDQASRMAAAGHCIKLTELAIVKTFIDFNVFDHIPNEGSISISSLSEKVGGTQSLVERFSNFLLVNGVLSSPTPGHVSHTLVSRGYKSRQVASLLLVHVFNFFLTPAAHWLEYFETHGLTEPQHANVIPLGMAMGYPDRDFYGILKTNPRKEALFNLFLSRIASIVSLKDIYDFGWLKDFIRQEGETPLIVDVGGGKGQGLKAIFEDYPYIPPGRCVLLDRAVVIEENRKEIDDVLKGVQLVEGNMFEEQPVKGALIYLISRVLNDWPDEDCIKLLRHIRIQAAPNTRVLIVEELLLENPSPLNLTQDIFMLSLGGKRRNEKMFQDLAAKSGWAVKAFISDKPECGAIELVPVA